MVRGAGGFRRRPAARSLLDDEGARRSQDLPCLAGDPWLDPIFVMETGGVVLTPLGIAFALAEGIKLTQGASLVVATPCGN